MKKSFFILLIIFLFNASFIYSEEYIDFQHRVGNLSENNTNNALRMISATEEFTNLKVETIFETNSNPEQKVNVKIFFFVHCNVLDIMYTVANQKGVEKVWIALHCNQDDPLEYFRRNINLCGFLGASTEIPVDGITPPQALSGDLKMYLPLIKKHITSGRNEAYLFCNTRSSVGEYTRILKLSW